jgi:hypothetical protein
MNSDSDSDSNGFHFELDSVDSTTSNPATAKTYVSPVATALNKVLLDVAQQEADAAAACLKKKNANKTAAKYVVKIAAASNDTNVNVSSSASTELLFQLAAICNSIARMCRLGIGPQFAKDMLELGSHQWLSSIMRRPSTSHSTAVQAACCHALGNVLMLTKAGTMQRLERQNEFIDANVHVGKWLWWVCLWLFVGVVGVTWVFLWAVLTQFHVVDLQPFVKPWVLNFAGPTVIALSRR